MSNFQEWLKAVCLTHWGTLTSGILGVIFQIAERRQEMLKWLAKLLRWPTDAAGNFVAFKWWGKNRWVTFGLDNMFWVGGVLLIFCSFYSAWNDEHGKLSKAIGDAQAMTNKWIVQSNDLASLKGYSQARIEKLQDALITMSNHFTGQFIAFSNALSYVTIQGNSNLVENNSDNVSQSNSPHIQNSTNTNVRYDSPEVVFRGQNFGNFGNIDNSPGASLTQKIARPAISPKIYKSYCAATNIPDSLDSIHKVFRTEFLVMVAYPCDDIGFHSDKYIPWAVSNNSVYLPQFDIVMNGAAGSGISGLIRTYRLGVWTLKEVTDTDLHFTAVPIP
jgi:hypothetical protein